MRLLTAVDIVLLNGHKRKRKSCYVWNLDTISVRQPAPAPAQQYFPLTPLQPPAPAPDSQQYFSLTPLQSPAPAPA